MIENMAWKMATHIKSVVPDHPASHAVLNHILIIVLNVSTVILLTAFASVFTGKTREVLILLTSFAILRQFSGGLHLKSSTGCALITSAVATGLSFISLDMTWITVLTVSSMVIVLLCAPSGIERQTIIPPRFFPVLKWAAFILVALNLLISSSAIAIAFFVQSITLVINECLKGGERS